MPIKKLVLKKAPEKSGASLCVDQLTAKYRLDSIERFKLEKICDAVNYEKYPTIMMDNLTLFATLYKIYPQKISKLEVLRILETVFCNWQSITTKNFRQINFLYFVEEGYIEKTIDNSQHTHPFDLFGLTEKAYNLFSDFVKNYYSPSYFTDPFLAKLIALENPKTKKELLFAREIVRKHKQMIASYLFYNRERYVKIFSEKPNDSIDFTKEYFKIDFLVYNTLFDQYSDLLRRINKKLKIENNIDAYFYSPNQILGNLKNINTIFQKGLGTRMDQKDVGPSLMKDANDRKLRYLKK